MATIGTIYFIKSLDNPNVIYIGSTKQSINQRWNNHKKDCKRNKLHLHQYINENGGIDRFFIEGYMSVKYTERKQLLEIEGEAILTYKSKPDFLVLNKNIAGRTQEECKKIWYDKPENIEKNRQYMREWLKIPENVEKRKQRFKDNALWFKTHFGKEKNETF